MSSSPPIHAHTHHLSFSSSNAGSPTWYGYGNGSGSGPTSGTLSSGGYGYGYGSAGGGSEGRRGSGSGGPGFGFGGGGGSSGHGNGGVWAARYGAGGSGGGGNSGNSGGNRSNSGYDSAAGQRRHEEELINAYEAEEERIINVLSRKLEKLREDKIDLENALEAESENHVNRMTRELSKLRQVNAELEARLAREAAKSSEKGKEREDQESGLHGVKHNNAEGSSTTTVSKNGESSRSRERRDASRNGIVPPDPEPSLLLDALRRENEELRSRLGKVEKDYARVKRLNEVYREELIVRRGRVRFLLYISPALYY
ncbi:hypothetical protein M413DRAFT_128410 [Hebeloma cylindrosporum]|uniref:Uncharacterized protein n=1 Tax=Hebeloma cylindrosporum TaxID=76867 RepID=A0A0C3BZY5_HEBCY|nr:hypothetical protein M413DRAFT_128410 [Hebeloma cylindrosporum h7]